VTKVYFILGDQLSTSLKAFKSLNKDKDSVFMCEVMEEATYVPHHPKKIAFIFSAMRHFAKQLEKKGYLVHYVQLDNPDNTHSFDSELFRMIDDINCRDTRFAVDDHMVILYSPSSI